MRSTPVPVPILLLSAAAAGGAFEAGFMAAGAVLIDGREDAASFVFTVAAAAAGGSLLAQAPAGIAADRLGPARLLRAAALLVTAALVATALHPDLLVPAAVIVGGAGGALYTLACIAAVARAPGDARHAIALTDVAYTGGTALSPLVMGTLAEQVDTAAALLALSLVLTVVMARATAPSPPAAG